jgi:hypothetical protein
MTITGPVARSISRWMVLHPRGMMFGGRRHFRELLNQHDEGISSNTLPQAPSGFIRKEGCLPILAYIRRRS